ncbi:MAG: acetyltransferase [Desulfarculus sp.]|nr:acetyltransferase [Desulfarculus sp.]
MAAGPQKILILGTGGNCRDVVDILLDINAAAGRTLWEPAGFLDDDQARWGQEVCGLKVHGPLNAAPRFGDCLLVNIIGSPLNHRRKPEIAAKTGLGPERFATLVHPTAVVSRWASLGAGCVLFPQVCVHNGVRLDAQVIVLAGGVINHDTVVGDYTFMASGARISGQVKVGACCYLGSNSVIRGGLKIGRGSLVGMGGVVIKDVPTDSVVAGNPARLLRAYPSQGV